MNKSKPFSISNSSVRFYNNNNILKNNNGPSIDVAQQNYNSSFNEVLSKVASIEASISGLPALVKEIIGSQIENMMHENKLCQEFLYQRLEDKEYEAKKKMGGTEEGFLKALKDYGDSTIKNLETIFPSLFLLRVYLLEMTKNNKNYIVFTKQNQSEMNHYRNLVDLIEGISSKRIARPKQVVCTDKDAEKKKKVKLRNIPLEYRDQWCNFLKSFWKEPSIFDMMNHEDPKLTKLSSSIEHSSDRGLSFISKKIGEFIFRNIFCGCSYLSLIVVDEETKEIDEQNLDSIFVTDIDEIQNLVYTNCKSSICKTNRRVIKAAVTSTSGPTNEDCPNNMIAVIDNSKENQDPKSSTVIDNSTSIENQDPKSSLNKRINPFSDTRSDKIPKHVEPIKFETVSSVHAQSALARSLTGKQEV